MFSSVPLTMEKITKTKKLQNFIIIFHMYTPYIFQNPSPKISYLIQERAVGVWYTGIIIIAITKVKDVRELLSLLTNFTLVAAMGLK